MNAESVAADIAKAEAGTLSVKSYVARVLAEFGGVDGLAKELKVEYTNANSGKDRASILKSIQQLMVTVYGDVPEEQVPISDEEIQSQLEDLKRQKAALERKDDQAS